MSEELAATILLSEIVDELVELVGEAWDEGLEKDHTNMIRWRNTESYKDLCLIKTRVKHLNSILGIEPKEGS